MRHLDYLLEEWDVEAEPAAVRERVARLREGIDRFYIYLEALRGGGFDPAEVYAGLFSRGLLFRRWTLFAELRGLACAPLSDDRARPLLWFLLVHARRTGRLLVRLERARRRGRQELAQSLRDRLEADESALVPLVRRKAFELFRSLSPEACPACGARFVEREEYFGGTVLLGCTLCAHAESARAGSEDLARLIDRWTPA